MTQSSYDEAPAPYGQIGPPQWPPPYPQRPRAPRITSGELATGLAVVAGVSALGVVVGLCWALVSPRVHVVLTPAGPDLRNAETDGFFAADGTFFLLAVAAGLLTAVAAWAIRRQRGPIVLVALAVGGLAGAWVAWKVGSQVGLPHYRDLLRGGNVGSTFDRPVDLRAKGPLLVQALVAVASYVGLASWTRHGDLDRRPGQAAEDHAGRAAEPATGESMRPTT